MNTAENTSSFSVRRWHVATRVLFRFALLFFVLDAIFGGTASPLSLLPWIGNSVDSAVRDPMDGVARWVAVRLFHLTGPAATLHIQATGDTALRWVTLLIILSAAVLGAAIWSVLDDKRHSYEALHGWFRLFLRITLGVALLRYGFIKVFPIQFPAPPLAVLNEPVGDASPTMLFWTLYGLHPVFQMSLGWIEVTSGMFLFFRRSSFAGAVLAFVTVLNVALLDCTFNVPVKLYSLTLVAMSTALLAPDFRRVWRFFSTQTVLVTGSAWGPQIITPVGRSVLLGIELFLCILACWKYSAGAKSVWAIKAASTRNPPAITGGWRVLNGSPALVGGNGQPIISIYFDPNSDTYFRAADGSLWRARAMYDREQHHLRVLYEVVGMWNFRVDQPDSDHLILTPLGQDATQLTQVHMERLHLPNSYPLLADRFHWVDEFGGLR